MVLSTDQELITSRYAADVRARFCSERRVPTAHPECLAQRTPSLPANRNARRYQFVALLEISATAVDRTPVVRTIAKFPALLHTLLLPRGDHRMICVVC